VTPLALELDGDVAVARSTSHDAGISAVAVCFGVQRLEQSDAFPGGNVEGLLDNAHFHPRRVLHDDLFEHESVTGHPVADDQIMRLVGGGIILDGTASRYGIESKRSGDQDGQNDHVFLRQHFASFHTRKPISLQEG